MKIIVGAGHPFKVVFFYVALQFLVYGVERHHINNKRHFCELFDQIGFKDLVYL